ncbi:MAG TPA: MarR family transcriptional regulator [Armatimonadota bacterium]|jgi:MarR family 2-MHQ and catechol resistance regulon transcriptional repressor
MPVHYRGTQEEVRALGCYTKLMRAADSVTARLGPRVAAEGLTFSQFGALEALLHLGPLCQKELGAKLLKTGGNITLVVDNLEKRGLVRRERQADDRRYIIVSLTDEGRRLIRELFPSHAAAIAEQMGVLSPEEQEQLACLCRRLGLGSNGPAEGQR